MYIRLAALLLVGCIGMSQPAWATAIVDVRTEFIVNVLGILNSDNEIVPLPDTVTQSPCQGGCFEPHLVLSQTLPGETTETLIAVNDFVFTNSSDDPVTLMLDIFWSSFNPGGPDIGARVDDPTTEFASFSSIVAEDGSFSGVGTLDQHSCETTIAVPACGVPSPDDSGGLFQLPIAPGQLLLIGATITVSGTVRVVPEPGTAGLLATSLPAIGIIMGRRKLRRREIQQMHDMLRQIESRMHFRQRQQHANADWKVLQPERRKPATRNWLITVLNGRPPTAPIIS